MRNAPGNPHMVLALALAASTLGSALLLLDLKMNTRNTLGMNTGFGYRSSEDEVPLEEGGASKTQARSTQVSFSGPASDLPRKASSPPVGGYLKEAAPRDQMAEESYYAGSQSGADYYDTGASADARLDGSGFSEGFYGGGASASSSGPSSREKKAGPGAGSVNPSEKPGPSSHVRSKAPPPGVFGGPAIKNEHDAGRDLYASLKGNNPRLRSDVPAGVRAEDSWASGQGQKAMAGLRTGGLEGMAGGSAGLSADGASESMASSSRNLPSSMKGSGGGSSSGGSAPAPGAPEKSAGGGGGGGEGGGSGGGGEGGSGGAKDAGGGGEGEAKAGDAGDNPDEAGSGEEDADAEESVNILKTIMVEKRNGTGMKYLTGHEQDAAVKPMLAELSQKAVAAEPANKIGGYAARLSQSEPSSQADPAEIDSLPQKRVEEVKTETHIFLARVESAYGQMTDIEQIYCADTPKTCADNGISDSYLTMTAGQKSKLTFGLKYVDNKWRRYIINFTK